MQEEMNGNVLDNDNNTNSNRHSVSVEDILRTIDMFLDNESLNDVPSDFVLRLLRHRITNPEG
jgi:hypothetical protein